MTTHQAFIAINWFPVYQGEVGHTAEDIKALNVLLDIIKNSDELIPERDSTYRQFYEAFMEFQMTDYIESL